MFDIHDIKMLRKRAEERAEAKRTENIEHLGGCSVRFHYESVPESVRKRNSFRVRGLMK